MEVYRWSPNAVIVANAPGRPVLRCRYKYNNADDTRQKIVQIRALQLLRATSRFPNFVKAIVSESTLQLCFSLSSPPVALSFASINARYQEKIRLCHDLFAAVDYVHTLNLAVVKLTDAHLWVVKGCLQIMDVGDFEVEGASVPFPGMYPCLAPELYSAPAQCLASRCSDVWTTGCMAVYIMQGARHCLPTDPDAICKHFDEKEKMIIEKELIPEAMHEHIVKMLHTTRAQRPTLRYVIADLALTDNSTLCQTTLDLSDLRGLSPHQLHQELLICADCDNEQGEPDSEPRVDPVQGTERRRGRSG